MSRWEAKSIDYQIVNITFLLRRSVQNSIIKRSIDLLLDFRKVDPDDLSAIFKWVSTKTLLFALMLMELF